MRKFCPAVLFVCASLQAQPIHLRTNALDTPLGIDTVPRFSWQSDAHAPGWTQSAYQIVVKRENTVIWDSGRVSRPESVDVAYAGRALAPQQRYTWTVRTWGSDGAPTASRPASFDTGLMQSGWNSKVQWIAATDPVAARESQTLHWMWLPGTDAQHVPVGQEAHFRYVLKLDRLPNAASLHVMVRGSFTARVNGTETGHHESWGAFDREEILPALHVGDNVVEIDATGMRGGKDDKTLPSAAAASIHLRDADGREQRLVSVAGWLARTDAKAAWQPAQDVGPLTTPFGLATNRRDVAPSPDRVATAASLLRKPFTLAGVVHSARLTITALGAYQASLNGQPVAPNTLLSPGWTDFRKRVQYQTYDVTKLLQSGSNMLGVELGGGWYSSPLTWTGFRATPGPNLLRAQLDVTLINGNKRTIVTDDTWQSAPSPSIFGEIYGGESYDARLEHAGWNARNTSETGWLPAYVGAPQNSALLLTAQPDLPIHHSITVRTKSLDPASSAHPAVFDMGQNIVGNVQIHVRGQRGSIVRLRYAERLNPDGSIYTMNLRNADATDTYVLRGDPEETWSPKFTFHGFRYVEWTWLKGSGTLTRDNLEGLVQNSLPDLSSVRLTSSSEVLNRMEELGAWGQRGNFVSIPTDCPQRDERLGWMGDAGVFWRTATFNFPVDAFTHKFMLDVEDAQTPGGAFSNISPNLLEGDGPGAPGWGDAGIFIPYAAWLQYGDVDQLEQAWPAMKRWMDFILASNPDHLRRNKLGNNYGDWLAPDPHTPNDLIGTAYWALIARNMAEMAAALHRGEEAKKYRELHGEIAAAFRAAYVDADGTIKGDTQTGYAAALFTEIAPPEQRAAITAKLVANLKAHNNHLTTGFLGTPFLLSALEENGRVEEAFALLLNTTYPSWGYMVSKGATTWWERWNGDTGDPGMNSYNHYAFGSVMSWVYRRAAGLDTEPDGAGFRHLHVEPHFSAALPRLHVEYDSAYGTITSDWDGSRHQFTLKLPANTTASVVLPGAAVQEVSSGAHSFHVAQ